MRLSSGSIARWRLLIGSWFWISPIRELLFLRFYCMQEPSRCFTCQLDANSLQCMTVVTSYWLFLESSKYALGKKRSIKSNCINTPLINREGNGFLSDVRMLVWQFGYDESKREQLSDAMERLEDVARFLKLARIRENNLFQCLFLFHVSVFT